MMTKRLFFTVAILFTMLYGNAQEKSFGVRTGYLSSSMTLDGESFGSSNDNYFFNIYKDTKVFPFMFFQSGLEYSRMGGIIDKQAYSLDYLGVPLALKVKFGPFFAMGGASFNVKLSEDNPFDNNPIGGSSKWFDTNAFVGAGIEILVFTFDAKYMKGLTDVNSGIKNNGFQVGVGLRF